MHSSMLRMLECKQLQSKGTMGTAAAAAMAAAAAVAATAAAVAPSKREGEQIQVGGSFLLQ